MMKRIRSPGAIILLTALSAGCAYYNGLYNANAFAHRAEKAEREGRTLDAQSLWGQVAVKAETVLARHPRSKWATEARFLQGKSLERLGDCGAAVGPLGRVVSEGAESRFVEEAALRLSACMVTLGDLEAAGFAVVRLVDDPDPARRAEARWRAGLAYRHAGRAVEAVPLLQGSTRPEARGELAAALADAGRPAEGMALADSLLAVGDTLAPWGAIVAAIGRVDTLGASALLDRILSARAPSPDSGASWLTTDARRLLPRDEARGLDRFEAAYAYASTRSTGVDARIFGLRHRLGSTTDLSLLDTIPLLLAEIEPSAGDAMMRARQLVVVAASVKLRHDSLVVSAPEGDLRGFLLGEALRDSVHAPRLAAQVWRRVLAERPESPYAPKLLLAIAATDRSFADTAAALLAGRYAASPYVVVLSGQGDPMFRVLEDSLGRFAARRAASSRAPARPATRTDRPTPTPTPAAPVQ